MSFPALRGILVGGTAVAMAAFTYYANIRPVEASYWAQVATNTNYASGGQKFVESFEALKRSFDLNTYLNVDMRLALHGFALSTAQSLQGEDADAFKREVFEYLELQFRKNLTEHHPDIKDFLSHTTYARIAELLVKYDPSWSEKAIQVLSDGVEEYPQKYQLFQALGRMYARQGKYAEALAVYEKMPLAFAPGPVVFEYAATLVSAGKNEEGRAMFRTAVEHNHNFGQNLPKVVDILLEAEDYGTIALVYENQLKFDPENTQILASLAETYRQTGDVKNARRIAEVLLEKDPDHRQETEAFLQELER